VIKTLLIFLLPVLLLGGGYFYINFTASQNLQNPAEGSRNIDEPIEVPKSLPKSPEVDQDIAETTTTPTKSSQQTPAPTVVPVQPNSSLDAKVAALETVVNDLRIKVSNLEKSSSTQTSSSKPTIYIPLGSAGQTQDTNWTSLNSFQISLDPASYSGYTAMQLEVTMRLNQPGGEVFARLYNSSSGVAVSSEVSSTSTTSSVATSATFTLPSGSKNYLLQVKSKDGSLVFIDYARIKVNF